MKTTQNIALFDLDQTLINEDSDYLWGEFLCKKQIVDSQDYRKQNAKFFASYKNNQLNIDDYLKFCLKIFTQLPKEQLFDLREEFIDQWIKPSISKKVIDKLDTHKKAGDQLIMITATNDFITAPIAKLFAITTLIATQVEMIDGNFTGSYIKPACFQKNKVQLFQQWLKNQDFIAQEIYAYSDSINDLALLQLADHPIATNPDEKLKRYAQQQSWKIEYWFN